VIFRQWQQVLDGTKMQTRRLVKPNELASGSRPQRWIHAVWIDTKGVHDRRHEQDGFIRCSLVVLESLYRLKWAVARGFFADKTYAIQPGRGKKAVGRFRITKIRRERVQDISPEDCWAEGIQRAEAQGKYGNAAYHPFLEDYLFWDVKMAFAALWDSIYKKPDTRFEDNPEVWVLTFERAEDG